MTSQSSMASLASQICNQIATIFSKPTDPQHPPVLDLLVDEISSTVARKGRVFLYGVGREGLMLKALCMRLFHLGAQAHFVFDMTTPPITGGDLLVASAGPGGFSTVDALCAIARSHGARVLLLTAQPETGSCVKHASVVGHVPAQTMAEEEKSLAVLPMGSAYEGALFVLFEMAVYRLGEELGQNPDLVRSRHTNLDHSFNTEKHSMSSKFFLHLFLRPCINSNNTIPRRRSRISCVHPMIAIPSSTISGHHLRRITYGNTDSCDHPLSRPLSSSNLPPHANFHLRRRLLSASLSRLIPSHNRHCRNPSLLPPSPL